MIRILCAVLWLLYAAVPALAADWRSEVKRALKNGGAYVEDRNGKELFSHRADEHFVPASTLKIATVAAALHHFGENHRGYTEFFLNEDGDLFVKGFGDPTLVSEELALVASRLSTRLRSIRHIVLDDSYFSPAILIDGAGSSSNPYDAINGALLANFNTIHVRKRKDGSIVSAEPQTPLTPIASRFAKRLPVGTHRVNLGADRSVGVRYVGELLQAFLRQQGVMVTGSPKEGKVPIGLQLVYRHTSGKTLSEVSRQLLKYSTNFFANQLFLLLGAERFGAPATVEKGRRALQNFLVQELGWKEFAIYEGAGLSRRNQVSPRQMVVLLRYFEPHKELLSTDRKHFLAKTGSLTGVSSYAGYLTLPDGREVRFALFVNDKVPMNYRYQVAELLRKGLAQ